MADAVHVQPECHKGSQHGNAADEHQRAEGVKGGQRGSGVHACRGERLRSCPEQGGEHGVERHSNAGRSKAAERGEQAFGVGDIDGGRNAVEQAYRQTGCRQDERGGVAVGHDEPDAAERAEEPRKLPCGREGACGEGSIDEHEHRRGHLEDGRGASVGERDGERVEELAAEQPEAEHGVLGKQSAV